MPACSQSRRSTRRAYERTVVCAPVRAWPESESESESEPEPCRYSACQWTRTILRGTRGLDECNRMVARALGHAVRVVGSLLLWREMLISASFVFFYGSICDEPAFSFKHPSDDVL
jgi:hypothetical protein